VRFGQNQPYLDYPVHSEELKKSILHRDFSILYSRKFVKLIVIANIIKGDDYEQERLDEPMDAGLVGVVPGLLRMCPHPEDG
jgi:hypothetical protein